MEFSRRVNGFLISEDELPGLNVTNDTLERLFYSASGRAGRTMKREARGDTSAHE